MQLPIRSLLANLELIRATHPELRTGCIFLQTWLELAAKGRLDLDTAVSGKWMESIQRALNLSTLSLFQTIPVNTEAPVSSGFAVFEDEQRFWLTDGIHSVRLAHVAGFSPCIAMISTRLAIGTKVFYLVDGSYVSGLPIPDIVKDFRRTVLVIVRENGLATHAVPMMTSRIQIIREAEHAAA